MQHPTAAAQHVFSIQSRTKVTTEAGVGWGEWADAEPGRRFTKLEAKAYAAELEEDDFFCTEWRAVWDTLAINLEPRKDDLSPSIQRAFTKADPKDPLLNTSPWNVLIGQCLAAPARRVRRAA